MERIGVVSRERFDRMVDEGRELVELQTKAQFRLGDMALEIEPIQPQGSHPVGADSLMTVAAALGEFADSIGIPLPTLESYRYVCSRWPEKQRVARVSFYIHRILASREDRFELIANPPEIGSSGVHRWTPDAASRMTGWTPRKAVTLQEKVNQVHDLVDDDGVATQVVTDLLNRPAVAFRAMGDRGAVHQVNRAQLDRARQSVEVQRQQMPVLDRIERDMGVLDVLAAADAFVSGIARALPRLQGTELSTIDIRDIRARLDKVRTASDWAEAQLEHLDSIDAGLAKLLSGD